MALNWEVSEPEVLQTKVETPARTYDLRNEFSKCVENNQMQMALLHLDAILVKIDEGFERLDAAWMDLSNKIDEVELNVPDKPKKAPAKKKTTEAVGEEQ